MALSIITSKRRLRKFLVYDLEWKPSSYELRLFGVYDGERYRAYRTVLAFLKNELTSKNRGKWFYAHAGGLADFSFLLEEFAKHLDPGSGYTIKCAFSGSSAIIVQVSKGKNSWTFVDSYWLLRDKLSNIAKWLGTEKGENIKLESMSESEVKEFYENGPFYELLIYNEQDCVILWDAINAMQKILWDLGGQLQRTLASSAMHLFRRKFLHQDIQTGFGVNERATKAYFASRVEVLNETCYDADYVDINSSFPYAMLQPQPGECLGSSRIMPDEGLYLADVEVSIPETWLPPIPTRIKGRLFFPIGQWRSWLSNVDIELLREHGGKILKVHEVLRFSPFHDLAEYANTLYDLRKNAQTPFERTGFKLLLNSVYGKFAESTIKSAMVINPATIERDSWEQLFPGVWLYEKDVPVPHRHVPISTHITALARRTLFDFMDASQQVHYCDTDGFSTITPITTSNELGGLKLEKRIRQGDFVGPKCYRLQGEELQHDGSWEELGDKGVKVKGFSRMNVAKWGLLMEGGAIEHERMYRIKEQARRGFFKPDDTVVLKKLQNVVLPKRFHYPDGATRPWDMKELKGYFGEDEEK